MHPLGPLPNAMWAIGCLFDFPSAENLCKMEYLYSCYAGLYFMPFDKSYTVPDQTSPAADNSLGHDE
jgi:hypothetical protein